MLGAPARSAGCAGNGTTKATGGGVSSVLRSAIAASATITVEAAASASSA